MQKIVFKRSSLECKPAFRGLAPVGWLLVVSKRLEGLSGQMEATFSRSHLPRWLLIEGLSLRTNVVGANVASRKSRFAKISLNPIPFRFSEALFTQKIA